MRKTVKLLAIVRVGRSTIHKSWLNLCDDLIDVVVSDYDEPTIANGYQCNHLYKGGKLAGISDFFLCKPEYLHKYTHFWLLEDDLYIERGSVLQLLKMLERFSFELCSPALSPESYFSWPIMIQNSEFSFRITNFVEQMAPVLSLDFLQRSLPFFKETQSGWGIEWLWHKLLSETDEIAAIIDSAPITHTRPVGAGTLYAGIDFKEEMREFLARNLLPARPAFINLFGVDLSFSIQEGDDFREARFGGYRNVKRLNRNEQAYALCVEKMNERMPFAENRGTKRIRSILQ